MMESSESVVTGENAVINPGADVSEDVFPLNEANSEDDNPYCITWTIYIALAFPPEEGEISKFYKRGKTKANPDRGCYHIEYRLLPGDTEVVQLDLLFYGSVVKLYRVDGFEILKTWTEGGQIWVGWSQDYNVEVNRAMAIDLLHHKITVHLWDHKDKLFSKARFQRRRPLRPAQNLTDDTEMCGGVKSMVTKIRSLCRKTSSSRQPIHSSSKQEIKDKNMTLPETATNSDYGPANEDCMASFQLSPEGFLADEQYLTNWALVDLGGVNECMIQISLERPLLSDQLKAELNPLAITIHSATSMPSTPMPFHVLEETCMPVYCQYKFLNLKMHRTKYEKHGNKIYFRDVNIIFIGLLNPLELHEFLSGPTMTIEIHDRDRKQDDETPVGFSGIPSSATSKWKKEDFNYHGVASLNLSKLLLGTTNLNVCLPIKSCPLPLDRDTASNLSVPPGHYINANSELKVRIKLACPLNFCNDPSKIGLFEALYGRIVYIFDRNNIAVMDKLRQEILKSNAEVFELGSHVLENTENSLFNYTTYFKRSQNPEVDYVTGFHLVDKRTQIVVVEGLRHNTVRRLWESVSMKLSGCKEEQVIVLYNSSLAFFKRIYDTLDLSLMPIILPESMEMIMMEPLIYIRSIVPPFFLQGLLRLKQLCQVRSLKDAVEYNLFPSAEMIQSLSRQFKPPTQQWKQVLMIDESGEQTPDENQPTSQITETKENSDGNISKQYGIPWKPKNHIQENIKKVHEDSARQQRPVNTIRLKAADDKPAHNYSIQTFNTNELNKQWILRQMAKLPGRRFTYSHEYCNSTVEQGEYTVTPTTKNSPPDPSEVFTQDQVFEAPKLAYKYFAPLDTWDISRPKVDPKAPDQARVEELRKPWRENILHGNILKPLSRDPWSWSRRSQDFQRYHKAMPVFSTCAVRDHTAGELLQEEQTLAATAQHRQRDKKLLLREGTGSVPEFRVHMANTHKFDNILKDEPQKYSLKKPGMLLKPVPHLSVISHSGDVTDVQGSSALAPRPRMDCSLKRRDNAIPRHSTEFPKYHYMRFDKKSSFLYKRASPPLTEEEKDLFNSTDKHITEEMYSTTQAGN